MRTSYPLNQNYTAGQEERCRNQLIKVDEQPISGNVGMIEEINELIQGSDNDVMDLISEGRYPSPSCVPVSVSNLVNI